MTPLVVITDSDLPSSGVEEQLLTRAGLRVRREDCRSERDVEIRCGDADALIVQWAPISDPVLDALSSLRFISRLGIGYDMIDVPAATRHGVVVANTPDYCIDEVVAHSLALILDRARGITTYDRSVRASVWEPVGSYPTAMRPSLATVAVIGFGRIGRRVAQVAQAIGFAVIVHDPYVASDVILQTGHEPAELLEALGRADIVTLHAALTERTHHLIDADAIEGMRTGAHLVNTCRGGLVDESALIAALSSGRLGGAGLDVYQQEPLAADSKLRSMSNVTLTPHAAWYSAASLADLPVTAASQVIDFFAGRPVASAINPEAAPQ
jgi:D-3-phosphoglycerate dehydrogenase / 2-oxoglutarate reductase